MTSFRIATLHDLNGACRFIEQQFSVEVRLAWTSDIPALVCWYIKSSLCGIYEDVGTITALVMGRPVTSVQDGFTDRFLTNWKGTVLWVECLASVNGLDDIWKDAVAHLTSHGCKFTKVAWHRMKRNACPFVFDFESFNRKLA